MIKLKEEPKRNCYYYNFGDNPNFEYHCPTAYGARCEFYDEFFSLSNKKGLNPNCAKCEKNNLEGLIE